MEQNKRDIFMEKIDDLKCVRYCINFAIPNKTFALRHFGSRESKSYISRTYDGINVICTITSTYPLKNNQVYCSKRDCWISSKNGMLNLNVICDCPEHYRYFTEKTKDKEFIAIFEKNYSNTKIHLIFSIKRVDFLSYFNINFPRATSSVRRKRKSGTYKVYTNAFRPYQGGRCSPK